MTDTEKREYPAYYAVIPADVRYDKRLCANAKLLYGEITALSHKEGYCWATDGYFASLYEVGRKTVNLWVQNLKECGYISIEHIYAEDSSKITQRRISIKGTPCPKNEAPLPEKKGTPCPKNRADNITRYNNIKDLKNKFKNSGGECHDQTDPGQRIPTQTPPPLLEMIKTESARNGFFLDPIFVESIAQSGLDPLWISGDNTFLRFVAEYIRENKKYRDKPKSELNPLFRSLVVSAENLRSEYPAWKSRQEKKGDEEKAVKVVSEKPKTCPHCGSQMNGSLKCTHCGGFFKFDDGSLEYKFHAYERVPSFRSLLDRKRQLSV
ncbi:MAG: helix-turn-helix domain-containing protein [Treponema sp.]|jgi:hypothetical protein|nr:helix-turn-helix domain-containing protein [Treponema sp.]